MVQKNKRRSVVRDGVRQYYLKRGRIRLVFLSPEVDERLTDLAFASGRAKAMIASHARSLYGHGEQAVRRFLDEEGAPAVQ
ncbi:MAG: hypothetical protein O2794_03435 [bacterium]|nr:hypothetical protein [bacterium]